MRLGSRIAVVVVQAGSCRSELTPSLGTSICHGYDPKKTENKKSETESPFVLEYCLKDFCVANNWLMETLSSSGANGRHAHCLL